MKYPDMNQYITLLFSLLTEFFATQNPSRRRGRPRCYTDASLLVFFAAMTLIGFHAGVVYEDKSLFKACGLVWYQKDKAKNYVPPGLRNVDKTAAWGYSGYRGWVYGYGLHLTCTCEGFPVLFDVRTAKLIHSGHGEGLSLALR